MILADIDIRHYSMKDGMIEPFNNDQLQPASYDVKLGVGFLVPYTGSPIDLSDCRPVDGGVRRLHTGYYMLRPWDIVVASTEEKVDIPENMVGRIEGKSSLARFGLQIHSAGYLDPGFRGNVTLEIVNFWSRSHILRSGMLIAQLSFERMTGRALNPYSKERNHYQDSEGAVESRYDPKPL